MKNLASVFENAEFKRFQKIIIETLGIQEGINFTNLVASAYFAGSEMAKEIFNKK